MDIVIIGSTDTLLKMFAFFSINNSLFVRFDIIELMNNQDGNQNKIVPIPNALFCNQSIITKEATIISTVTMKIMF